MWFDCGYVEFCRFVSFVMFYKLVRLSLILLVILLNDVISNRDEMFVEYVGYFFWGIIIGFVFGYRVYLILLFCFSSWENVF